MSSTRPLKVAIMATLVLALVQSMLLLAPAGAQQADPEVEVGNVYFAPEALTVQVGQTVVFPNVGGSHSVSSDDCSDARNSDDGCYVNGAGAVLNSDLYTTGQTFSFTFDEPGTYPYFCFIHSGPGLSGQNGTITVEQAGEPAEPPVVEEPLPPVAEGQPQPVDGTDPVATALSWSGLVADGGADVALIGTAGGFADSLASGVAQGTLDAPLLLTGTDALDQRVADELARLGTTRVVILGGTAAISPAVEQELATLVDTVDRAAGATRLQTALAVADLTAPDATEVILARAFGEGSAAFADALAAGAVAAANGLPVVLTPTESLDPALGQWLVDRGVTTVHVAGGTAAISDQVVTDLETLGLTVVRAAGGTRFATAVLLGRNVAGTSGAPTLVEGTGDLAWASGFAAARSATGGVVLSAGAELPGDTISALLERGTVVCGPTIATDTCAVAQAAGQVQPGPPALYAVMAGDQETPPNDSGASGEIGIARAGDAGVCLTAVLNDLTGPITVAHIHDGGFGESGPPVVPFTLGLVDLLPGVRLGCVTGIDPAVIDDVFADPAAYYVNIHTDANPAGEIRGQAFELTATVQATLTGDQEVPGPGDPTAIGVAEVYDTGVADELCYVVDQGGLTPAASMAHIHRGAAGESGPVVVPLVLGAGDRFAHCDRGLDPALVEEILTTPEAFYVNLHNEDFPAGAIRGNLGGGTGGV